MLEVCQSALQHGDVACETFDLSIARVRCSSSGRGPRRISGPGRSGRSVMPGRPVVTIGAGGRRPSPP